MAELDLGKLEKILRSLAGSPTDAVHQLIDDLFPVDEEDEEIA